VFARDSCRSDSDQIERYVVVGEGTRRGDSSTNPRVVGLVAHRERRCVRPAPIESVRYSVGSLVENWRGLELCARGAGGAFSKYSRVSARMAGSSGRVLVRGLPRRQGLQRRRVLRVRPATFDPHRGALSRGYWCTPFLVGDVAGDDEDEWRATCNTVCHRCRSDRPRRRAAMAFSSFIRDRNGSIVPGMGGICRGSRRPQLSTPTVLLSISRSCRCVRIRDCSGTVCSRRSVPNQWSP